MGLKDDKFSRLEAYVAFDEFRRLEDELAWIFCISQL